MPSPKSRAGVVATLAVLALTLVGCTPAPEPTPTPTATQAAPVDTTPKPAFDGTAEENQAFFDLTNRALIDAGGALDGRSFIDNLVAAGYSKSDMEVTKDQTAINLPADNIQFSIRLNGTCLIGQYGNIGYASTTASLLATGRCLVGETRTIDW